MRLVVKRAALAAAVLAMTAGTAAAQRPKEKWSDIKCDISTKYFLVNSAVLYLKHSTETTFEDQRKKDLNDAKGALMQSIQRGRTDDPAVWYLLGRYYEYSGDPVGADSAFDRVVKLAPDCSDDINTHRRALWIPFYNASIDMLKANKLDSALALLTQANAIYQGEPPALYFTAQIFANRGAFDSALVYYKHAIAVANDSANKANDQYANIRTNGTYDVARIYASLQQNDSALAWYQRYRTINPKDAEAMVGEAGAYTAAGQSAPALALYDSVLTMSDSLSTEQLFSIGVEMFRQQRYDRAVNAIQAGLKRNPLHRDALFNLANTYLAMSSNDSGLSAAKKKQQDAMYGAKIDSVAQRLEAIDPASQAVIRLLATGYQLQHMDDSTIAAVDRLQKMKFDVTVGSFHITDSGAELKGVITNAKDSAAADVPTLKFQFVDTAGDVVATDSVPAQHLDKGGSAAFTVKGTGEKIAAWRYMIGG